MAKGYLLGVDIGTYESKGVLTTLDGEIVSVQVRPHNLSIPRPGWAEHDAEQVWWQDFCSIVQGLLAESKVDPKEIHGVGCSAIGPCMLPVDQKGNPMRQGILYGIDTRATAEIAELEEVLGADRIYDVCGATLSAQSVGPKILWERHHEPEIYQAAHKFVTSTTFLVARLTGNYYIDHYTAASFHPLYDLAKREWNPELAAPIVEVDRLPELGWTTDIAGTVTREAAAQTGLAEGTPVIIGTVDAAAEAVSVGVVSPGQIMIMYGSTVFMIEVLAQPKVDPRLWSAPYLFPGTHCMMAGMATSGALTRWFRDHFAKDLVMQEQETGINAYGQLAQEAAQAPPGAEGLIVLPYFSGERTPINDPRAKGVIMGLTLAHTRGHVYRAILEGIGYGINHHFQVLKEIGVSPHTAVAVGGGTKNPLWLQIVSDICNTVQLVPAVTIGASYGDAFLAGLGVGVFSTYRDIAQWLKEIKEVRPNPDVVEIYQKQYELYLKTYQQTKEIMHDI
ncbi:MAG: FGGY-family carbohydrate kinase [Firmicutes bacterium]|nr:FGGY-family carbohydrate kinase [Bacillota bacterium]